LVTSDITAEQVYEWLEHVPDPEIPVLSILDLGIVRDVSVDDTVTVSLTPTYSGCPATEAIESSVLRALNDRGVEAPVIKRVISPPWTTDWITDRGRQKLLEYGIAPPQKSLEIACPQCASLKTELVSEFGSTACKASRRCLDCLEPFEYFKCL
jgi:ring-1,2-phenylacetyl-CoA epoxidase subunit PaaD